MADYTYDSELVADPFSFQRAADSAITIYDVADENNLMPLVLKDLNGLALPNPLTSSSEAFLPAFVAPSPQVKMVGGGLQVVRSSFQGVRDAAVAAASDAEGARIAAEAAVELAQAPTDSQVDAGVARADIPGQISAILPALVDERVEESAATQVPPLVAAALASDPTVAAEAAALAQSDAGLVRKTDPGIPVAVPNVEDYAKLVTDSAGRVAEGTRWDGTQYWPHMATDRLELGLSTAVSAPVDGYVRNWQDIAGRDAGGLRTDGSWFLSHLEVNTLSVNGAATDGGRPWKILIAGGQSNDLFKFGGYIPTAVESESIKLWNNTDQRIQTIPDTYGSSAALEFAREYVRENPGERVLIVPAAVGSTGFRTTSITPAPAGYYTQAGGTWDRTLVADPVNLYASMISRSLAAQAAAGAGATFLAMIWSQGEADRTRLTQSEYSALLHDLIVAARAALGTSNLAVVIGSMTPEEIATNDVSGTLGIAAAHIDQPRITEYTSYVWGPANMTQYNEDIHWSPEGNRVRAKIMATDGLRRARLNVATSLPAAPINPRISRSGNVAVIEWDAPFARATEFHLETSTDSGTTWVPQTLSGLIALRHEMTVPHGTPLWARLSTTNEVGTSRKTLEVKA